MPPKKAIVEPVQSVESDDLAIASSESMPSVRVNDRAKTIDIARRAILKHVKQETITANFSSYPYVPSGSFAIDDLIGGSLASDGKRKCPGYPRKRISEIYGPESSGKTTAALHAVAEVQKMGGIPVYLDFEHALDYAYAKQLGVSFDPDALLLYAPNTFEEGFKIINLVLQAGVDLVVADSVPSMIPTEDLAISLDKEGRIGNQPRLFAKNLPKLISWLSDPSFLARNPEGTAIIFLNQERAKIGGMGHEKKQTPGGFALKYYASLRLQFYGVSKATIDKKNMFTGKNVSVPYGTLTNVKVVKNKIDAKQGASHTIFIRYGYGIDDAYSLIMAGIRFGLISQKGASYSYGEIKVVGKEKFRSYLLDNLGIFNDLRDKLVSIVQASSLHEGKGEDEGGEISLKDMSELDDAMDEEGVSVDLSETSDD